MELKDLVGSHVLTGVDTGVLRCGYGDASTFLFTLDGVTYLATEDPDDGYRSCLGDLERVENQQVANTFPSLQVVATYSDDVLTLIDITTGKPVLEVGTDYSDGYYPCFVGNFHPENMAHNQPVKAAEGESK